jgi:hypothetical protein
VARGLVPVVTRPGQRLQPGGVGCNPYGPAKDPAKRRERMLEVVRQRTEFDWRFLSPEATQESGKAHSSAALFCYLAMTTKSGVRRTASPGASASFVSKSF